MTCANLGAANDYNVFVLGDHSQSFVDAEGRVAVGGTATYRSYGIGNTLNVSTTRADLIVGGNMDIVGGTNFSGNSVIGPSGTIINYTMTNNNGVLPQPQRGTPIDFAAAAQYLTCASSSWGALAATGTAAVNFGGIALAGTDPSLNIFNINGSNVAGSGVSLNSANGINIVVPNGSTALVNISGTGVGFGNYSIFINGQTPSPGYGSFILWNFYEATTAFNLNLSIIGSVLAPFAEWDAVGFGNINGTMAAKAFINTTGTLEAHNVPFDGCLPAVFCTPQLAVRKTVNAATTFSGTAGTPLTYVIQVINAGGGNLTNITVNDPLLGFDQTVPQLSSGQEMTYTINSAVQYGDPGSSYANTVFVSSDQTTEQTSSVTITVEGYLNVGLVKTADRMSAAPGDTIEYQFVVTNPGQATLNNVTLTDATLGIDLFFPSFVSGTIATIPFTVPAKAVIGSALVNAAVLNASNLPAPVSAQASVTITETPSVTLNKSAVRSVASPGDTIMYTVIVSNDSLVTPVTNLHVTDPLISLDQTIAQLNPQASSAFDGTYAVPPGTPAGTVILNTAMLQSSLGTLTATDKVTVAPAASISIAKTPRPQSVTPGDTVVYDIVVTNTGNVPLTNVTVSDPALSFSTTIGMLAVGGQSTAEALFHVPLGTEAGTKFFNTASVQSDQTAPVTASSEIIVAPSFSTTIRKHVAPTEAAPGDTVMYTITVTNTSNATITNVVVTDPTLGVNQTFGSMPPGASIVIDSPFAVPAGAVAGSIINNTASVVSDQTPVRTSATHITVTPAPSLELTKSVTPATANPGDVVTYTLTLTNVGNIALTNVRLLDPTIGVDVTIPSLAIGANSVSSTPFTVPAVPAGTIITNTSSASSDQTPIPVEAMAWVTVISSPAITLTKTVSDTTAVPGQTVTFDVSLTNASSVPLTNVLLADPFLGIVDSFPTLLAGETKVFTLEFIVPAQAPEGTVYTNVVTAVSDQTPGEKAQATVTVLGVPGIAITKTADATSAPPGDTVNYAIVVTNTGNTTLHNVLVTDDVPSWTALAPTLRQGTSATFNIPYTLTGTDLPGSIIIDTATAKATETASASASADVLVTPLPSTSASIQKLVEPEVASPGDSVAYTIIVTNNTLIDLVNIRVTDPTLGLDQTIALLDAGDGISLIVPYVVPSGTPSGTELVNTATATVLGLSLSDAATLTVAASPEIALTKTADVLTPLPGDTVNYTLTVTNTGNVALTNIVVADPALAFSTVVPSLAIGESASLVVPFLVPADPLGTIIQNTSTATSDQTPTPVEASAYISVGDPATLAISKTAVPAQAAPGETVVFTIVVTNTSAATLTNLIVSDPLFGWFEIVPTLLPSGSKSVSVNYVIPSSALAGSTIANVATAFSDQTLPTAAEAPVSILAAPSLALRKVEDRVVALPGSQLRYAIQVTNTGNTSLTNVTLNDPLINLREIIPSLAPGASVQFSATFLIPSDALAGERIINWITASSDQTAPVQTFTNIRIGAVNSMLVSKTALSPTVQPGTSASFLTVITNTSNDTLTNILISDPLVNLTQTISALPPETSITLTSNVPVADDSPVNSTITNRVSVSSTQTLVASAESTVTVLAGPKMSLDANLPSIGLPGQLIPVTLVVSNTGNETLHNVRLSDSVPPTQVAIVEMLQGTVATLNESYTIPSNSPLGSTIRINAVAVSNETTPLRAIKSLLVVGLAVEKRASASMIELGGIVEFFVKVTNPIALLARDVVLIDPLPAGTSLVQGSVAVDGRPVHDANLTTGVPLGLLANGASVQVAFKVRIDKDQPGDRLVNQAFANFAFIADIELRGTSASNTVNAEVLDNEE